MSSLGSEPTCSPGTVVLATDLDGTLIPLEGNNDNRRDLETLRDTLAREKIGLTFVTGRHLESVEQAMSEHQLPRPDWIICDVGTSIFHVNARDELHPLEAYRDHLDNSIRTCPIVQLRQHLAPIAGIEAQEDEKQGRFKLSYYADANRLPQLVEAIATELQRWSAPYWTIASVDPFNGDGLINLLPNQVSKAYALDWWTQHHQYPRTNVMFAGDSGNDLQALASGYPSILVSNAKPELVQQVRESHQQQNWKDRLFVASMPATSGVLEGVRHFGRSLFDLGL